MALCHAPIAPHDVTSRLSNNGMMTDGNFLVRASRNTNSAYTLSLCYRGSIMNYRITYNERGYSFQDPHNEGEESPHLNFPTMEELIGHHTQFTVRTVVKSGICTCVCVYVCMCACTCMCMCMCVHAHVCGHAHVCTCACVCVGIHMCMHVHAHVYVCGHVHVCTCTCVCVGMHMYVHAHVYMWACTCMCMPMCMCGHVHVCACTCVCMCMHMYNDMCCLLGWSAHFAPGELRTQLHWTYPSSERNGNRTRTSNPNPR